MCATHELRHAPHLASRHPSHALGQLGLGHRWVDSGPQCAFERDGHSYPRPSQGGGTTLTAYKTVSGVVLEGNDDVVYGLICVTNGGSVATQNLAITDQVEFAIGGASSRGSARL